MGQTKFRWRTLWYLCILPVLTVFGRSIDYNSGLRDELSKESFKDGKTVQIINLRIQPGFDNTLPHHDENKPSSVILLRGQGFEQVFNVGLTLSSQSPGSICSPKDVHDLETPFRRILEQGILDKAYIQFQDYQQLLQDQTYYVCTKTHGADDWIHHGPYLTVQAYSFLPDSGPTSLERAADNPTLPSSSHMNEENLQTILKNNFRVRRSSDGPVPEILGMTFEYESDKKRIEYDKHGSPRVLENMIVTIRLFGQFNDATFFKFSKFQKCDDPNNHEPVVPVIPDASRTVGEVTTKMPPVGELNEVYLCLKTANMSNFVRQGESNLEDGTPIKPWLIIKLYKAMLPLWLHLIMLSLLLVLSGLFSGLNLGLMSLNKTDLKIIINTGTVDERNHASKIAPVRNHGNFLLCCLLFSNVLVNASLTILVDDLTSGLIAIMMSTLSIVIFGEIIPQAICSRHGLAVGARTIYVTKFFMLLTFPLAYPLSKILDRLLGEEIGSVYTRERLKELLRVTKDHHGLETEEVGIISGALEMKTKTVKDIMIRLDNVFMLPIDAVLDFDTMAEVEYHGYSRIPIYERERENIVALLNVKQLTLLDANDNIPLKTVIEYYQNSLFFVFENTRLDYMFRTFREGSRGHMAFVQRINDEGPGDPFYETIGLVTMEDVLEELLQAEIMDESDIGKYEARLANQTVRPKSSVPFHLIKRKAKPPVEIPAPLALAAVQFLSTTVEPFKKEILSVTILQRLVASSAQYIKIPKHRGNQEIPELFLFEAGKPAEYFILILEGRVEVSVGQEKLTYESGAFTTFGKDFLMSEYAAEKGGAISPVISDKPETKSKRRTFLPDYTVKVLTDLHYMMLKYSAYKAAILATGIERANADPIKSQNKNWQDEIEKMLEEGDDDTMSESGRKISKISSIDDGSRKTSHAVIKEIDSGGDHPDEQTKLL